ncbi:MAG: ABC transporter substrate-binding protein [Thermodesulfobacteriota bacterium]|jgi:branched-chain amino acid transport system substrate-binding protein
MKIKEKSIIVLMFILVVTLCSFPSRDAFPAEKEKPPIVFGGLFMLSGRAAVVGLPNYQAALLAVEEINARGGLLGRKLELLARDTKAQPAQAVKEATMYIMRDKVDFLYGTASSSEGLAVAEVALKYKKILFSPEVTTDKFTVENFNRYIFRTDHMNTMEMRSGAIYMAKFPYKRWYTIGPDYEYGHDAVRAFVEEFKKMRPDVTIAGESWPKLNEPDYTPHIQKMLEMKPDAIFSALWGGDSIAFIKQGVGFGLFEKIPYFCVGGVGDSTGHQALGKDMPVGLHGGVKYWFGYDYTPKNKEFVQAYRNRFGDYPSLYTMCSYVGMQFMAKAIEKAGTVDTEKVVDALAGLTIDTPIGPQTLRKEDHTVIAPHIWGKTCKDPKYDFLVMCNMQVVPGEKNAPSIEEVMNWRKAAAAKK